MTFATSLGRCGVHWTDVGIAGVELPGPATDHGPRLEDATDIPRFVADAIAGMTALLGGARRALAAVPLAPRGVDGFRRRGDAATRTIPAGTTATYGAIARAIGRTDPEAARDVGAALSRNPFPIVVPCHRVVGANGKLTGFSAPGGLATKRRMLELEGAPGFGQQVLFG